MCVKVIPCKGIIIFRIKRGNMQTNRYYWEEISEDPEIYRICSADGICSDNPNGYLIVSCGEALAIDVFDLSMMRTVYKLALGLEVRRDKIDHFMTHHGTDPDKGQPEYINAYFQSVYCGADERSGQNKKIIWVSDGDRIRVGEFFFTCVGLPGTSDGAVGLWFPAKRLLFAGEAFSFERLPMPMCPDGTMDMLGLQFETIRRIRSMRPNKILTGTGRNAMAPGECSDMADQMTSKYCLLLLKYYQIVCDHPGLTAEELDIHMLERNSGQPREEVPVEISSSLRRYLLYRRFIVEAESEKGVVFERGSMRLTDWKIIG